MKKKRSWIPLCTALFFLAATVFFAERKIDRVLFSKMTEHFFVQSLENDTLSLHYTLAEPEKYGLHSRKASLPVYSSAAREKSVEQTKRLYHNLQTLRPERLSPEEFHACQQLSSYLKEELEGAGFVYYEEPLSPTSGMHTELLLLLAEYTFRSKQDVQTYLELLTQVPDYLDGLGLFQRQKAREGLFMPKEDALETARQCLQLFSEKELAQNTHVLQTTFARRLEQLAEQISLTPSQKADFLAQNQQILTAQIAPAYHKLAKTLETLTMYSTPQGGLCRFPKGKEYYAWMLSHTTGCSMDPDTLFLLLKTRLQQDSQRLHTLAEEYTVLTGTAPDLSLLSREFSLTDPQQILSDLKQKMAQDFPRLSDFSPEAISCTIKDVDPSLESFTSPAYYMTPPVDACTRNTICINRSSTAEGVELYTTLAHEGYPGHLFQNVYAALSVPSRKLPVTKILYYGGYTEGWAYYAERLSYDWAAQVLAQNTGRSLPAAQLLCELSALQRDLQINLFCMADISLHYRGSSPETVKKTLQSFGIPANTAAGICDYLRTSPAAYQKYYVGYLEILALQAKARELWKESYTDLRFHTFLLENGPADFAALYRLLTQEPYSSNMLSRYPLSQSRIFNFLAAATAGSVKY